MSEYQYYAFRALEQPLTKEQMAEIRSVSSRGEITSHSYVNEYQWGDFKGSPEAWMKKYFDVFIYYANWGSRWCMLRVPKTVLDEGMLAQYAASKSFSYFTSLKHFILSFNMDIEDFAEYDWPEEEVVLNSLIALRSELMCGDYRCLYLGWLLALRQCDLEDDGLEPPIPSGLDTLTPSLEALAEFLVIESDVVAIAAKASPTTAESAVPPKQLRKWVAALPEKEKNAIITALIEKPDTPTAFSLRKRALQELERSSAQQQDTRRTTGKILALAEAYTEERLLNEAEERAQEQAKREREAAEKRQHYIQSLKGKEKSLWQKTEKLIQTKQPAKYDEAVVLLLDLQDLARMQNDIKAFQTQFKALCELHERKSSLLKKLQKTKLIMRA